MRDTPLESRFFVESTSIPHHCIPVRIFSRTSGTFSPTLRQGIGLALLDRSVENGSTVHVDIRGRQEAFTVTKPPFVEPKTREA